MTIGQRLRRLEDPPLLLGRGRYVGDVVPAGARHAAILRSPYAHARIRSIDVAAAAEAPGVVAVITALDLPGRPVPIKFAPPSPGAVICLPAPLATDNVRYAGEAVAVVVAASRYEAEDALGLVAVDYEPLPPVLDADAGLAEGTTLLFPALRTNEVAWMEGGPGVDPSVFDEAALVVEETLEIGRHFAVPIEPRGIYAEYDPKRGVVVHGPTKAPHFTRQAIAGFLGLPEHEVHVIEPDVGGGFGARGEVYAEDLLVPWLAMKLGEPVAWLEDRREHMMTANHSRQQRHRARLAVGADGTLLALEDRFVNDQGAYLRGNSVAVTELTVALLPGPYRFAGYHAEASCVLTNKTPTDVYRAPGRFEGTFVRERLVDIAAHRLGIDPVELRRRNLIRREEMPYDVGVRALGSDTVYDSGDFPALLERAVEEFGYEERRERQLAEAGNPRVGIGAAFFVEKSGYGPWEYARVEVAPSGQIVLYTGVSSVGQGISTTLAQLVAAELGTEPSAVDVVYGDTDRIPFGIGAFASRGGIVGGTATVRAVDKLKAKIRALAAQSLEASEDDLELVDGGVQVRGVPASRLSFGDVAAAALPGNPLPDGMEPGLTASDVWTIDHMTYSGGVCLCTVSVDVETGLVEVGDFVIVYDIGRAINPMIVEGQLHGGVVQGIGGALLEELRYDEDGQPLCTSFMDYLLPASTNAPRSLRVILDESTPSPLNPLGLKGAGEAGIAGAGACVANAIADALRPEGAEVLHVPVTPADVRRLVAGRR